MLQQLAAGDKAIVGVMVESNLEEGNQSLPAVSNGQLSGDAAKIRYSFLLAILSEMSCAQCRGSPRDMDTPSASPVHSQWWSVLPFAISALH